MHISSIANLLLVFSGIEALSFSSFKDALGNRGQVQQVMEADYLAEDFLSEQIEKFGYVKELESPVLKSTWHSLLEKFDRKTLEREMDAFNHRAKGQTLKLKNKFESNFRNTNFEGISNKKFKLHSLRIKKTHPEDLGLDSVDQYTGYLDVEDLGKHFFYWFFESRNDPENDPVILWLNGGPGCSSATGMLFELGPSLINETLQPVYNPYSWNSNASVIFLDQPVGVGYSYTTEDEILTTAAAAKDVYVFLELFFQKFPQFVNNKFHIAGESYAGHYIPQFASEIVNHADRSFELTSVLIGNGITDSLIQNAAYKPMACGEGGYHKVLKDEKCDEMDKAYPRCAALTKLCYKAPSAFSCVPSAIYCNNKLLSPYVETNLNPYDIRKQCEGPLCYSQMSYLELYLNLDHVKKAVGAEVDQFNSCDENVGTNFFFSGDHSKPFQQYVSELLDKGIPVLVYAGDKDYICNWLGNHAWTNALDYGKHDEFKEEPLRPWYTFAKKQAGQVQSYDKFTFLRVYDAGHMVPYDQPENSLDMVNRWIAGEYSFGN